MSTSRVAALSAALLAATPAHAQDALNVELQPTALLGEGMPGLVIHAQVPLERLRLSLKRSTDGKRVRAEAGPLGGGRSHRFELPIKRTGKARFTGTLSVELGDGTGGEMPIDVQVEVLAPLKVQIAKGDVDVAKRRLTLRADRAVKRVQVTVMSDTGTPLGTTEKDWKGDVIPAGEPASLSWKQSSGTVMRITVQAWDENGFFGAVDLFPWQVDIPHEEVHFATASFDIAAAETTKLDSSFDDIVAAIDKYGSLARIRLFIAGHTDTVGDAASNRVLSNNRARAIGRWFRKRGVTIPISCAGFGEDLLLVETPDSTDEAKNRRAEYIVSVDPPSMGGGVRWKPL